MLIRDGKYIHCDQCGATCRHRNRTVDHSCGKRTCRYQGEPLELRWGQLEYVKCGCKREELREVYHVAHECSAPQNKTHRCLPQLNLRTDEERQKWAARPESQLYHACQGCGWREPMTPPVAGSVLRVCEAQERWISPVSAYRPGIIWNGP